ncbi:MAG TPA: PAS domain-containing sensor histidine kinase [Ktedonobacterales bacterium]|nr:PAS domain-containing sensor histidine kinase [Ktedonobacterales bacterium]
MKPRHRSEKTTQRHARQFDPLAEHIAAPDSASPDVNQTKPRLSPDNRREEREWSHLLTFMQAVLGALDDGAYAVNRVGQVTFMNPAAEHALGWTKDELRGKDLHETIHFQRADGAPFLAEQCPLLEVMRSGEVARNDEDCYTRKDGLTFPVASVSSPLLMGGETVGAVVVFHGISERKHMEEALRRSEQIAAANMSQLGAVFESMADAVIFFGPDGRLVQVNPAFRKLLGIDARLDYTSLPLAERGRLLTPRDEQGRPLPEDQWLPYRVLRGEMLTGSNTVDFVIGALDGHDVLLNGSGAPVRDINSQIAGGVLILRDVTERRRQEQLTQDALRALLAMAETLVSAAPDPAEGQTSERTSKVTEMERLTQRLAHLTRAVLGCERVTIVPVGPAGEVRQTVGIDGSITAAERQQWQALAPQQDQRHLHDFLSPEIITCLQLGELVQADRQEAPFNSWPNPLGWRSMLQTPMLLGGRLVGILTMDYSGPELRMFAPDELALAAGAARLAALVLERERLLLEREEERAHALALTEANRRMDEFLGIATHELKTPVTSSSLCVELATDSLTRVIAELTEAHDAMAHTLEPIHKLLVQADAGIARLSRLMEDLLDVSRIRAGKLEFRWSRCDLAAIVRDAVREQSQIASNRAIILHLSATRTVRVWADAERIGQVVANFLTNALKYSPEDCPVQVSLRVGGGWARVSVKDAGLGIARDEQDRIWHRFQRGRGIVVQSGSSVGLGLGLYIAKTAIERHQGRIGVVSAPGAGSTFWFALPIERSDP